MRREIVNVNQKMISEYKDEFKELMYQLTKNSHIDYISYCEKKYEDLYNFICDRTAIMFAAMEAGKPIGYVWAYRRSDENEKRIHITQIVVDYHYRGTGVGNTLIQSIVEYAQNCGIVKIELNVAGINQDAYKFYQRNGFSCERILLSKDI